MNYLDTSALVKRFVTEKGSDLVSSMIGSGEPIGTAKIAYAEVFSGLARKRRTSKLSEPDFASLARDSKPTGESIFGLIFSTRYSPSPGT